VTFPYTNQVVFFSTVSKVPVPPICQRIPDHAINPYPKSHLLAPVLVTPKKLSKRNFKF